MSIPYGQPHLAPATTTAADGETTLHRFIVTAVIYAPDRQTAQTRLQAAHVHLDHATIVSPLIESGEPSS